MRERGIFCLPGERRFVVAGVFFFTEALLVAGFTAVFATFRAGALPADTFFFAVDLRAAPAPDVFFAAAAPAAAVLRAGALMADFFAALVAVDLLPAAVFFTVAFPPAAFFATGLRDALAPPGLRDAVRAAVFPAADFPAGFRFADFAFEATGFVVFFLLSAFLLLATVILSSP